MCAGDPVRTERGHPQVREKPCNGVTLPHLFWSPGLWPSVKTALLKGTLVAGSEGCLGGTRENNISAEVCGNEMSKWK